MKFVTILLMLTLSLSACAPACSDSHLSLVAPDVKKYPQKILNQAADEMDANKCPVLVNVMLPDYKVCRDQSRSIK